MGVLEQDGAHAVVVPPCASSHEFDVSLKTQCDTRLSIMEGIHVDALINLRNNSVQRC